MGSASAYTPVLGDLGGVLALRGERRHKRQRFVVGFVDEPQGYQSGQPLRVSRPVGWNTSKPFTRTKMWTSAASRRSMPRFPIMTNRSPMPLHFASSPVQSCALIIAFRPRVFFSLAIEIVCRPSLNTPQHPPPSLPPDQQDSVTYGEQDVHDPRIVLDHVV